MSALDSIRFDDLRQRDANTLTPSEKRLLEVLYAKDRARWEQASDRRPHLYGGDYEDVF